MIIKKNFKFIIKINEKKLYAYQRIIKICCMYDINLKELNNTYLYYIAII